MSTIIRGVYKIGHSKDPNTRRLAIYRNMEYIPVDSVLWMSKNVSESYLHDLYSSERFYKEYFLFRDINHELQFLQSTFDGVLYDIGEPNFLVDFTISEFTRLAPDISSVWFEKWTNSKFPQSEDSGITWNDIYDFMLECVPYSREQRIKYRRTTEMIFHIFHEYKFVMNVFNKAIPYIPDDPDRRKHLVPTGVFSSVKRTWKYDTDESNETRRHFMEYLNKCDYQNITFSDYVLLARQMANKKYALLQIRELIQGNQITKQDMLTLLKKIEHNLAESS